MWWYSVLTHNILCLGTLTLTYCVLEPSPSCTVSWGPHPHNYVIITIMIIVIIMCLFCCTPPIIQCAPGASQKKKSSHTPKYQGKDTQQVPENLKMTMYYVLAPSPSQLCTRSWHPHPHVLYLGTLTFMYCVLAPSPSCIAAGLWPSLVAWASLPQPRYCSFKRLKTGSSCVAVIL